MTEDAGPGFWAENRYGVYWEPDHDDGRNLKHHLELGWVMAEQFFCDLLSMAEWPDPRYRWENGEKVYIQGTGPLLRLPG
jgi:hypothetical protein